MENMNESKDLDFLKKYLVDKIRKIEMYSPDGPIEDPQGPRPSDELFYNQRNINREALEEKSEKQRMQNGRGIDAEFNV
jgi:hypothetical protein